MGTYLNSQRVVFIALLLLIVSLLYSSTFYAPFNFDDEVVILQTKDGLEFSVTNQARKKCAVFGRKPVFVHDDGIYSFGRRLANFKCVLSQKKITGKTFNDYR